MDMAMMREMLPDNVATVVHQTVGGREDVPGADDGATAPALLPPPVCGLQEDQPGIFISPRLPPTNNPLHPSRLNHHQQDQANHQSE